MTAPAEVPRGAGRVAARHVSTVQAEHGARPSRGYAQGADGSVRGTPGRRSPLSPPTRPRTGPASIERWRRSACMTPARRSKKSRMPSSAWTPATMDPADRAADRSRSCTSTPLPRQDSAPPASPPWDIPPTGSPRRAGAPFARSNSPRPHRATQLAAAGQEEQAAAATTTSSSRPTVDGPPASRHRSSKRRARWHGRSSSSRPRRKSRPTPVVGPSRRGAA